jgi:hypothetical protein
MDLRPYARTPRQVEVLEALEAHGGNHTHTAKALGAARQTIADVVATVKRYAEQHATQHKLPIDPHVPGDHRLRGISTLTDAEGGIDRQWVKDRAR